LIMESMLYTCKLFMKDISILLRIIMVKLRRS
jgi:hypothetical protein